MILGFLKNIPIKYIITASIVALIIFFVSLYIRNAEKNRQKVVDLQYQLKQASEANKSVIDDREKQIKALTETIREERERENEYNDKFDKIRNQDPTIFISDSPSLLNAIRMRINARDNN